MNKLWLIISILSIALIYFFHSCNQEKICQDELESYANAGFYTDKDGTLKDTTFEEFKVRGLQNPDTIPFDTLREEQSVRLRLSQGSDSCTYVFSFAVYDSIPSPDTAGKLIWSVSYYIEDTMKLNYTRQIYLVSPDCGFSHYFELIDLSYTNNMIQSAEIAISEIGNFNEENIKIRF
ncbi:MAG: hypothetical protein JXB24_05090 [Bacteroidales bacterium]|nr:hypothetical protein [Bacteroidales bacterium]